MKRTEDEERAGTEQTAPRRPYTIPTLQVFGNAAALTQRVSMRGLADGAGNSGSMSRTG